MDIGRPILLPPSEFNHILRVKPVKDAVAAQHHEITGTGDLEGRDIRLCDYHFRVAPVFGQLGLSVAEGLGHGQLAGQDSEGAFEVVPLFADYLGPEYLSAVGQDAPLLGLLDRFVVD
jgi:hypothetical protein